ncbi:MAG: hypothetical protein HQL88_10780, partial [Magnetococcales bacterium]|nr:hypothetical protein [Magnetococcales bacterium]
AWLCATPLGRTTLPAGLWTHTLFGGVNTVADERVTWATRRLFEVIAAAMSLTTSGSGTSRTATAASGAPFPAADADANTDITQASYLQTPTGLYPIIARISDSVVTIATPAGYANETGVSWHKWRGLFSTSSVAFTSIVPTYMAQCWDSLQDAIPVASSSKLAVMDFVVAAYGGPTTLTLLYDGYADLSRNSRLSSTLAVGSSDSSPPLTTTQMAALTSTHIHSLTTTLVTALQNTLIAQLTSTQVGLLTTTQLQGLTATQMAGLPTGALAGLTATQIQALSSTAITALSNTLPIKALTTTQLQGLTATQMAALTTTTLAGLSSTQVAALTTNSPVLNALASGTNAALTAAVDTTVVTVASAATTAAIWTALGNIIQFTGSATVTDFPDAPQAGISRMLICAATPTFIHSASLAIQGNTDYIA